MNDDPPLTPLSLLHPLLEGERGGRRSVMLLYTEVQAGGSSIGIKSISYYLGCIINVKVVLVFY